MSLVIPSIGVGGLKFGMTRHDVRSQLGKDFSSFRRTTSDASPCDHFKEIGLFAYYDGDDLLEALEFASPAKPVLDSTDLLSLNFAQAKSFLKLRDTTIQIEPDGVTSPLLGIGFWAPLGKADPIASCESVIVFAPGYYD